MWTELLIALWNPERVKAICAFMPNQYHACGKKNDKWLTIEKLH